MIQCVISPGFCELFQDVYKSTEYFEKNSKFIQNSTFVFEIDIDLAKLNKYDFLIYDKDGESLLTISPVLTGSGFNEEESELLNTDFVVKSTYCLNGRKISDKQKMQIYRFIVNMDGARSAFIGFKVSNTCFNDFYYKLSYHNYPNEFIVKLNECLKYFER